MASLERTVTQENLKMAFTVREIGPEDANSYKALRLKALEEHPEAFAQSLEEAKQQTIDQIREEISHWCAQGGFAIAAVSQKGDLVGMVAVGRSKFEKMRHRGHIWGVYVDPATRGHGIAKKLFGEIVARARSLGDLVQLDIEVVTTNTVAFDLYKKLGFRPVGQQPRAIKVGEKFYDECLLVLDL